MLVIAIALIFKLLPSNPKLIKIIINDHIIVYYNNPILRFGFSKQAAGDGMISH